MTDLNIESELSELLAFISIAGFAVTRTIELMDPVYFGIIHAIKWTNQSILARKAGLPIEEIDDSGSGSPPSLPLGISEAELKTWLTNLTAIGCGLLLSPSIAKVSPNAFALFGVWGHPIVALAISAGSEGFNSVLKFAQYVKDARKTEPIRVVITPGIASLPVGQKLTFLVTISGTADGNIEWPLLSGDASQTDGDGKGSFRFRAAGIYRIAAVVNGTPSNIAVVNVTAIDDDDADQ